MPRIELGSLWGLLEWSPGPSALQLGWWASLRELWGLFMAEHLGWDPSPGFSSFESPTSPLPTQKLSVLVTIQLTPLSSKSPRLVNEVEELNMSLAALRDKLLEAEQSLRNLEDTRMSLEKDIAVKTNSLFIDRQKCMTHRTRYPTILQLAGYQ